MIPRRIRRTPERAFAVLPCMVAALMGQAAHAGDVSLSVKNKAGGAAEDTIVIFDPLDASPPPGHGSAVIDQIDKKFTPKINVIRTGTSVTFPNSDRIRHQVYSFSAPKPFSLKLYAGSPRVEVVFDKPGLVVLGCNIHDSMVAFVGIVDTPYFVKIPASGAAELNLPPGHYRMRVWNPSLAADFKAQPLTVGSEPLKIPLALDVDPTRDAVANWPD